MAFSYDFIRLFRRLVRHGRFAVDLEDILYWTVCFLLSFTLLYYGNNGVIRFAAVLGAAAGMGIYAVTLGRFFVKVSYWLIDQTIGNFFRLTVRIIRSLQRTLMPVKRLAARLSGRCSKIRFLPKYGLTRQRIEHKMKLCRGKDKGKGETAHGKSKAQKKQAEAKENAGVSPH
ncbi:MAG: spore cortex biosynthesis protein YabQ [Lachnospiraceae bacterium]|nr:spore cortex biosynthesis protein YabQ [Lachnospiraceae bacterium]MBO5144930.1 spore cortex biosynthesis protein YabQ [Lachnospiraceae bacterium]